MGRVAVENNRNATVAEAEESRREKQIKISLAVFRFESLSDGKRGNSKSYTRSSQLYLFFVI